MSTISLRIPTSLHERLRYLADQENISINQLITLAIAEKLTALDTEDYLAERAKRGSKEKFDRAMSQIKDREPEEWDRFPE